MYSAIAAIVLSLRLLSVLCVLTLVTARDGMITSVLSLRDALRETNCDGVGTFTCPTGTCYTGYNGFIGCCSVSNCAAQTTCVPYMANAVQTCDPNTGGCVVCSEALPSCVTITNVVASQYIMYCDVSAKAETHSYSNLITTGSMALPPATSEISLTLQSRAALFSTSSTFRTSSLTSTRSLMTGVTAAAEVLPSVTPPDGSADGSPDGIDYDVPVFIDGLSEAAITGIVTGIVVTFAIVMVIICYIRKKYAEKHHLEYRGFTNEEYQEYKKQKSAVRKAKKAQKAEIKKAKKAAKSGDLPLIGNALANNGSDVFCPIEHQRLARLAKTDTAATTYEFESSSSLGTFPAAHIGRQKDPKGWWKPNATMPTSAIWPVNDSPLGRQATQPDNSNYESFELSNLYPVYPSDSNRVIHTASPVQPASEYAMSPCVGATSPPAANEIFSPTPLVGKGHAGNQVSAGRQGTPTALDVSVYGPTAQPHNSGNHRGGGSSEGVFRALTNATGGGPQWVSLETAISEGPSADDVGGQKK
ncbi:MAG: hypothetical protein M1818_004121 [Claussenomyces sp. TS43310]|nr:MAG: hypothetical protein M1818_004121 [Claussenomyces sp. TS43310]